MGTLYPVPAELQRDLAIEIATDHPDDGLLDIGHGHSLLRLQVDSAVIANSSGAAFMPAPVLADADPDPFWEYESGLDRAPRQRPRRPGGPAGAASCPLSGTARRPGASAWPGLTCRGSGSRDPTVTPTCAWRSQPVETVWELSTALRTLAGCPYINSFM